MKSSDFFYVSSLKKTKTNNNKKQKHLTMLGMSTCIYNWHHTGSSALNRYNETKYIRQMSGIGQQPDQDCSSWEKEAQQVSPLCPLLDLARFSDQNKNGSSIPSRESTDADLRHILEFGAVEAPKM